MRPVRRPSVAAQYEASVAQWLREEPAISAVEIQRRVRLGGYRGGKSALYELVRRVRARSLDDQSPGTRQLIIIARNREHVYRFLQQAFEGNETVQVISDRRLAERRKNSEPQEGGGRHGSRRSQKTIDGMLRAIGWTIVRLPTLEGRRGPVSGQAHHA